MHDQQILLQLPSLQGIGGTVTLKGLIKSRDAGFRNEICKCIMKLDVHA
jgi:hypothetical protein